jgi:gliding motility-associated-like protein
MHRTLYTAILIGCSFLGKVSAQGTFMKSFGSSTVNEGGKSVVASPDGNYFVGGYRGDSALVMKVDPSGNIIWARTYQTQNNHVEVVSELSITPDNFLIGCSNSLQSNMGTYHYSYFKCDLNGNMQWIIGTNDTRPNFCHGILPKSASEYVLITGIYDMSGPPYPDPMQQGISAADGSILWNGPRYNYVDNAYIDDAYYGIIDANLNIYTTGRIYVGGGNIGTMRPYISKFDSFGQHIWTNYYVGDPSDEARVYGIDLLLENDSLTICYFGNITAYSNNFDIGLIHTNSAGIFAWGKNYQITNFSTEFSYKVLKMSYGYAITGFGSGGGDDLFILAVSNQGNLLWAKGYGAATTVEDIYATVGRNAIAIGDDILFTGQTGDANDKDLLLVRVDSSGNVTCGMSHDLNVTTTVVPPYTAPLFPTGAVDSIPIFPSTSSATSIISDHCVDPGPVLGNDTATCSPIQFTAATLGTGTTFLWQDGSNSSVFNATSPGTYWVEVTNGCCTYSDTVNVTNGSPAVSSFSVSPQICSMTITLTNNSTSASSYQWNFGDGQTSNAFQPQHTYDTTGVFNITLSATNGCGSQDTIVSVELLPVGSFSISGPDTLCANAIGAFTSTLVNASLSGITWSSGQTTTDITFATPISVNLFAIATDTSNCSYSDTLFVSIIPSPQAAFSFNALPCDSVVNFIDGSSGATNWQWNLGNGASVTTTSAIGHYTNYGTYTIEQVVNNMCGSDTASQLLTLGPTGTLTLMGPDSACTNAEEVYSALVQGTTINQIIWSTGAIDSTSISLSFLANSMLSVIVIGNDGCSYVDSTSIQVMPLPIASFIMESNPCDSSAVFTNSSIGANAYLWDFGNGGISMATSPSEFFNPADTFHVTLAAYNGCGSDTATQELIFGQIPTLELIGPEHICSNDLAEFHLSYSGSGLHNLLWSNGDTTEAISIEPVDGAVLTVTAINDQGCLLTSSYAVHYFGDEGIGSAFIPNVFTPNKDGINESFSPVILDGFISMEIFNRWGQEIYETTDVEKPWKGDYKGKPVPDGTYVYIVKWNDVCTGFPQDRIGSITVLR